MTPAPIPPGDDRRNDYARICARYVETCVEEAADNFAIGAWDAARRWARAADYWAAERRRSLRSPSTKERDEP